MARLWAMSSSPATIATSAPLGPNSGGKDQPRPRKLASPVMPCLDASRSFASVQVDRAAGDLDRAGRLQGQGATRLDGDAAGLHGDLVAVLVAERDGLGIVVEHDGAAVGRADRDRRLVGLGEYDPRVRLGDQPLLLRIGE